MSKHREISLRQAVETDAELAFRAVNKTMRNYAIATWGSWRDRY